MLIFISYARDDYQMVYLIAKCLRKSGYEVFLDKANLQAGYPYDTKIENAINQSNGFIFLITQKSLDSAYCKKELELAQKKWGDLAGHVLPVHDVYQKIDSQSIDLQKMEKHPIFSCPKALHWLEVEDDLPTRVCDRALKLWPFIKIHNYDDERNLVSSTETQDEKIPDCPYLGLSNFGPSDDRLFYGRTNFVNDLCKKIIDKDENLTVITGASGSGKSSVVLAGLIPELASRQRDQWVFTYFCPGNDPFVKFAEALSCICPQYRREALANNLHDTKIQFDDLFKNIKDRHPDRKILIIVDQFDQLFTQSEDICRKFIECMFQGIESSNILLQIFWVITMQGASLENPFLLSHRELHSLFKKNEVTLYPMNKEELRAAIQEPAVQQGMEIGESLITALIDEMQARPKPDNLAVLEFTLWKLCEPQGKGKLTIDAYQAIGGVRGAITGHAEDIFKKRLDDYEQKEIEQIFLRLAFKNESTGIVPRISSRNELEKYWSLVIKLAGPEYRLIIIRNDAVEVIHEALIREWDRIAEWVDRHWMDNAQTNRYKEEADHWQQNGKKPEYLIFGKKLEDARNFIQQQEEDGKDIPIGINEFLLASAKSDKENSLMPLKIIILAGVIIGSISIVLASAFFIDHQVKIEKERLKEWQNREDRLSLGGRLFFYTDFNKRAGTSFFRNGNLHCTHKPIPENNHDDKCALEKFIAARNGDRSDPETLIYLNNTQVAHYNPLTIAAIVPIGGNKEVAQEMLRGVAQAQDKVNQKYLSDCIDKKSNSPIPGCLSGIKGRPLQVLIGNDDNDKAIAADIADHLIKERKDVIAVIGHNASEVSTAAAKKYQKGKLVMVTPTSFALKFDDENIIANTPEENYIFAVAHSYEVIVPRLVEEIVRKHPENKKALKKPKVIICSDQRSPDQGKFNEAFEDYQKSGILEIVNVDCDFSKNENLGEMLKAQIKSGANNLFVSSHVNRIGDAISLIRTIKSSNDPDFKRLNIYGSPTLYTDSTLRQGKNDIEGLTLAVSWHPEASENNPTLGKNNFYNETVDFWKKPAGITWRTAMAYDTTNVIIEGLRKINNGPSEGAINMRSELQQILAAKDFNIIGVTGKVEFQTICLPNSNGIIHCGPAKRKAGSISLVKVSESKDKSARYEFTPHPRKK